MLSDWDPIRGSHPEAEYECLAHHVLSALHREPTVGNVRSVVSRELEQHFGVRATDPAIEDIARRILTWWGGISKRVGI